MSKFSNILKMIILLKGRGKMTGKELAKELEVSERMIRKYKQDLELAGVYVESIAGVNGGYRLDGWDYLLKLDLTDDEYTALQLGSESLKNTNFVYIEEYENFLDKVRVVKENMSPVLNESYLVKDFKTINPEDERKRCIDINGAIITRKKIKIKYFSLNSGESERVVHPYSLIYYKGSMYFVAYCEKSKEIRDFKILRIREYEVLNNKYEIPEEFSLKRYMGNSFGLYKGEKLKLKLRIYKPMSYIVSEKLWIRDQKIQWNEDESIIFQAEMQGKTEIKTWILSMGSKVKVIEPLSLKQEIKDEVVKMLSRLS